jgi:type VI protein secretion system component VasF
METTPEILALLTEIRDLLREQGAQYREMAARSVTQQAEGIAIARRAQRVIAPILAIVLVVLLAAVVWLWGIVNR